jgi:hypothetical protein
MSAAATVDDAMMRIATAQVRSPIAVFKRGRGELDFVFARTIRTQVLINAHDPGYVGTYHREMDLGAVRQMLEALMVVPPSYSRKKKKEDGADAASAADAAAPLQSAEVEVEKPPKPAKPKPAKKKRAKPKGVGADLVALANKGSP